MVKVSKSFGLMLISTILFFDQPESIGAATSTKQELSRSDTLMYLNIPARSEDAIDGSQFAAQITGLSTSDKEKAIVKEVLSGNVPFFSRKLRPLTVSQSIGSLNYELVLLVVCDYMAIGSDEDYLYIPMTPSTAQYLANQLDCSLPTKKIVDTIYAGAEIKLDPQPIPPSDKMTTVPVFGQHTDLVRQQISQIGYDRSADSMIAGHKKDIIISNKIYSTERDYARVVIYGWHTSNDNPIQPVYNGHISLYADYSHGVRLISNVAFIGGDSIQVMDILQDAKMSVIMSSEGTISKPYYPASDVLGE